MDNKKVWAFATLLAVGVATSPSAFAVGDISKGEAKSAMCVSCHGVKGLNPIPGYPKIGWQDEQYLVTSMKAYRNNERKGSLAAVMTGISNILSDEDINNLAAYYSQVQP